MLLSVTLNLNILFIMIILRLRHSLQLLNYVLHLSKIKLFITISARLSKYAAHNAQRKLKEQTPTEVNKGGPKLCVSS